MKNKILFLAPAVFFFAYCSTFNQTQNEVLVSTNRNTTQPVNGFRVLAPAYDLVNIDGRTNVIKIKGSASQWNVMEYSLSGYGGKPITIHLSADVLRTGPKRGMGWNINNEPDYPNMTMVNDAEPGTWYNMNGSYTIIPTNSNPVLSLSKWEQNSSNDTFFYISNLSITIDTWDYTPDSVLATAGEANSNGTRNYFVSVNRGSDGGNGTQTDPFQKIAHAMCYVKPGDTVLVDSGTYNERFRIPTGSAGRPVTLTALPNSNVEINPAIPVTSQWRQHTENIYVADISQYVQYIDTNYPQLFADSDSMVEARYPNIGTTLPTIWDHQRDVAQSGTNKSTVVASKNIPADIAGARVVIWPGDSAVPGWTSAVSTVRSVNGGTITLTNDITGKSSAEAHAGLDPYTPYPGNPFYVTGALALLDSPGEYYFDRQTGLLYFYPPWNGAPDTRTLALRSKNDTAIFAGNTSNVVIRDITVFGGGINMTNSSNNILENCRVFYAQHFVQHFYNDFASNMIVTGTNNRITKCEFGYTAGRGIVLAGDDTVFTNNYIHDTNYSGSSRNSGVFVYSSKRLEISHNTMVNQGGAHIYFGYENAFERCVVRNNYFENNAIFVPDGSGAFYTINTNGGGTEIYNNFVVVSDSKGDNGTMHRLLVGLYVDDMSFNYTVRNNIVIGGTDVGIRHGMTNRNDIPLQEGVRIVNNTIIGSQNGFGFHAVVFNVNTRHVTVSDNLLVNIKSRDIVGGSAENGKWVSYDGDFQNGAVPVTRNTRNRMTSSGNARGTIDNQYRPTGSTPDIGAIPRNGILFPVGADWGQGSIIAGNGVGNHYL